MSSASSNQLVVLDEVDYEEVYPSCHVDQESLGEDRSLSASSSSSINEDMEMAETVEISDDDEEPTLRSVIGANGLREFIILPEWTVNNFVSTIKETHFKTLRANYQIPENIPIRLPYKSKKCYYDGIEGVGLYEQILKAGLRFPLSTLHRELLKCLGLSVNQVSPNAWRIFIAMEILYGPMTDAAKSLTVREFLHCYRPNEIDKSRGVYSFCHAPNPIPGFVTMTGMLISSLNLILTRTNLTFNKLLQKLSSFFSFLFHYLNDITFHLKFRASTLYLKG